MNPVTRIFLFAGLLLTLGAAAVLLQIWAVWPLRHDLHPVENIPGEVRPPPELWRREQIAAALLAVLALAGITAAALLPGASPRPVADKSTRAGVELLARTSATQSEALDRERLTRQRTEENLAMEQMRASQAVADKVRLGRDLHDSLIQSLYATGLTLASARQKVASEPARAAELLDRSVAMLNATIRELRAAISGLSAQQQQEQTFPAAVQAVTEMLGSGRDAVFDLRLDGTATTQIGEAQYADLLQIIREAVSNALRHGGAKSVVIRLHEDQGRLCLLVQDDGCGFDPTKASLGGHGLRNLRARADLLRGELRVNSTPGSGTRLVLTFAAQPVL